MEVILLERIDKLGLMGDVVTVKPGFARNFLLPQKKAMRATRDNISQFESQKTHLEAANLERRSEAEGVAARLDGLSVVLVRQASDSAQLYGSVTSQDIAREITAAGFSIDKRQVLQERPIKTVGLHPLRIRLHPEVVATVTANVARSAEEAEARARGGSLTADGAEPETEAMEAAAEFFEEGATPEPEPEDAEATADEAAAPTESD